ncbi:hypothetical protein IWX50DRAFT_698332 [Phyllosticta citricarpa]
MAIASCPHDPAQPFCGRLACHIPGSCAEVCAGPNVDGRVAGAADESQPQHMLESMSNRQLLWETGTDESTTIKARCCRSRPSGSWEPKGIREKKEKGLPGSRGNELSHGDHVPMVGHDRGRPTTPSKQQQGVEVSLRLGQHEARCNLSSTQGPHCVSRGDGQRTAKAQGLCVKAKQCLAISSGSFNCGRCGLDEVEVAQVAESTRGTLTSIAPCPHLGLFCEPQCRHTTEPRLLYNNYPRRKSIRSLPGQQVGFRVVDWRRKLDSVHGATVQQSQQRRVAWPVSVQS